MCAFSCLARVERSCLVVDECFVTHDDPNLLRETRFSKQATHTSNIKATSNSASATRRPGRKTKTTKEWNIRPSHHKSNICSYILSSLFFNMKLLSFTTAATLATLGSSFAPLASNNVQSRSSTARNMFTGIIEEMGTVVNLEERDDMTLWDGSKGKGTELTVKGEVVLDGAYLG
jgi:hypothetical protein